MSIAELSMLVNDNFDKPLNQQLRDMQYLGAYLFTSSTKFTPDKNGYYKVIVVGKGGNGYCAIRYSSTGGAGGVAISTLQLNKLSSYSITIEDGSASFDSSIYATPGSTGSGAGSSESLAGGTASGGDFNYTGTSGVYYSTTPSKAKGVDVGVFIPSLMKTKQEGAYLDEDDNAEYATVESGEGILGYGAGGGITKHSSRAVYWGQSGGGACVIIIPVELSE